MKILLDVFPAKAKVAPAGVEVNLDVVDELRTRADFASARLVTAVRVVVTDEIIMIGADSPSGPMLIFRERYDSTTSVLNRKGKTGRLTTNTGKFVVFEKDADCGCGSMLRAWNPYRTVSSMNDPSA